MTSLNDIKPGGWTHYGLWPQPVFSAYTWVAWYDADNIKEIGVPLSTADTLVANGHFMGGKTTVEEAKKLLADVVARKDYAFLKHYAEASIRILDEGSAAVSRFDAVTPESFDAFIRLYFRIMAAWYPACLLSFNFEEYIAHEAKKGITYADVLMSLPKKETLVMKQFHDALKIKQMVAGKGLLGRPEEIKKDAELLRKIEEHVKTYAWIGIVNFIGEPMSTEKFLQDLSSLSEAPEAHKKTYNIPEEELFIPRLGQEIAFLRQYGAEVHSEFQYKCLPFLRKVAKAIAMSYDDMMYLTPPEIGMLLRKEKIDAKALIAKRRQSYCFWTIQGQLFANDDLKEVADLIARFVPKADVSVSEIKGTPANKGYAKGPARIIMSSEEFHKMKPGDILVTTMTTPDFVPLMQQSAAIVTDIGGLLSHAAIVSREMGKPCVIGMKIATQVLKDGDVVEVDAEKGIVKKVK
jgi:phosphohistidine swiveling domain-containing protein